MKKYKLIKTYPGSYNLGAIAVERPPFGTITYYSNNERWSVESDHDFKLTISTQPEFWEEVVEKEYEILSFSESTSTIHSIKRLSDGEIFNVGDKIVAHKVNCELKINSFYYKGIKLKIKGISESSINILNINEIIYKVKTPLFTTKDDADVFEGDNIWVVGKNFKSWEITVNKNYTEYTKTQLTFSNEEAAEEYIILNKPCLSIDDIKNYLKDRKEYSFVTNYLRELVKSKL